MWIIRKKDVQETLRRGWSGSNTWMTEDEVDWRRVGCATAMVCAFAVVAAVWFWGRRG